MGLPGDVLTFYNERIANESYLRTATQPGSIANLVALLGYQPSPGIAATGHAGRDKLGRRTPPSRWSSRRACACPARRPPASRRRPSRSTRPRASPGRRPCRSRCLPTPRSRSVTDGTRRSPSCSPAGSAASGRETSSCWSPAASRGKTTTGRSSRWAAHAGDRPGNRRGQHPRHVSARRWGPHRRLTGPGVPASYRLGYRLLRPTAASPPLWNRGTPHQRRAAGRDRQTRAGTALDRSTCRRQSAAISPGDLVLFDCGAGSPSALASRHRERLRCSGPSPTRRSLACPPRTRRTSSSRTRRSTVATDGLRRPAGRAGRARPRSSRPLRLQGRGHDHRGPAATSWRASRRPSRCPRPTPTRRRHDRLPRRTRPGPASWSRSASAGPGQLALDGAGTPPAAIDRTAGRCRCSCCSTSCRCPAARP